MLKEIIQLSLVVVLAGACNSTEEDAGGVYINPDEVLFWCTAGTPVEDKLAGLRKKDCFSSPGTGKGNSTLTRQIIECPTVEQIAAFFTREHQEELCMFSELGWLDDSGNFSEAAAMADLNKLPPNVTAVLSEDNIQHCMENVRSEMTTDNMIDKKCDWSDDDLAKLEELKTTFLTWFAPWVCYLRLIQVSCQELVEERVYDALYSLLLP